MTDIFNNYSAFLFRVMQLREDLLGPFEYKGTVIEDSDHLGHPG
jgi:hypothetical protein